MEPVVSSKSHRHPATRLLQASNRHKALTKRSLTCSHYALFRVCVCVYVSQCVCMVFHITWVRIVISLVIQVFSRGRRLSSYGLPSNKCTFTPSYIHLHTHLYASSHPVICIFTPSYMYNASSHPPLSSIVVSCAAYKHSNHIATGYKNA
jgi:hypothetical protein